jgi:cardiolipin synthase
MLGKRLCLTFRASPCPLDADEAALGPAGPCLEPAEVRCGLQPAHIQLYHEGKEALAALHELIDRATCRIDVLMFTWADDCVGREIATHLARKAGPQLRVRVLVDGGGNLIYPRPVEAPACVANGAVCWLARQPYVELLRTRNPFGRFDHRKLVLIDGREAWSGGRNFTHMAFCEWHDLSFTLSGPLAGDLATVFEESWHEQGGKPASPLPPPEAAAANAWGRLVGTGPVQHDLADTVYRAVDGARHHLYLENPYLSDSRMMVKLARARRRGVDVRVVLALVGEPEVANHCNRVTANRLLRAGVRVYLYPGMIHVKAVAADGCWAYLGTGNFDPLSLRKDRELGLAIGAGPLIPELEESLFQADMQPEWELTKPLPLSPRDYLSELLLNLV